MNNRPIISLGIIAVALGLAYAPIPGVRQTINVVSGTELEEPLRELETRFEQEYPSIDLELKFQGSQDLINNYIEQKNDFQPHILIPASGEILQQYCELQSNQGNCDLQQYAIAKTVLVGIAWEERGKILFPDDQFSWSKIERVMKKNWLEIANQSDWGNFDFIITNPTRSNSGQLSLDLWLKSKNYSLNSPEAKSLVTQIKQSVYQPPRSTDVLLQEFITRGANDGDLAMVYESIALYRWSQAKTTQGQPYRIYYPDPTAETVATAAVVNNIPNVTKAAHKFVGYLTKPEQQEIFIKYGFRPTISGIDLSSVSDSPWSKNIPGAMPDLTVKTQQPPNSQEISEIQRLWGK